MSPRIHRSLLIIAYLLISFLFPFTPRSSTDLQLVARGLTVVGGGHGQGGKWEAAPRVPGKAKIGG